MGLSLVHLQASVPSCWHPDRQETGGSWDLAGVLPEAAGGSRNAPRPDWHRTYVQKASSWPQCRELAVWRPAALGTGPGRRKERELMGRES